MDSRKPHNQSSPPSTITTKTMNSKVQLFALCAIFMFAVVFAATESEKQDLNGEEAFYLRSAYSPYYSGYGYGYGGLRTYGGLHGFNTFGRYLI